MMQVGITPSSDWQWVAGGPVSSLSVPVFSFIHFRTSFSLLLRDQIRLPISIFIYAKVFHDHGLRWFGGQLGASGLFRGLGSGLFGLITCNIGNISTWQTWCL